VRIDDLPTPALVVDVDRLEANLRRMAERCAGLGVSLRPHVKTHKCVEIAERQRAHAPPTRPPELPAGRAGITVSTLEEARVFADHGFDDLTWAFPVIPGRLGEAVEIARRTTLRLVVDSPEALAAVRETGHPFHVWLKVDCGYHRAGVDPAGAPAVELARALADSPRLTFDGLLSHSGQAYRARSRVEAARAAEEERAAMSGLAERLRRHGVDVPGVSVGSTPGMAAAEHLEGVTEVRPGNYAYFDFTQVAIGSCTPRECALTVLSSVVSCQPGAGHAVVDAGALALSKDPGPEPIPGSDEEGRPTTWGEIYEDHAAGALHRDLRLVSLSQEHGVTSAPLPVGERVRILPNHSCLAAACFDRVYAVSGDRVLDVWTVHRGR
jgi:D-serine deaminase-like pyridoxal phosphate-dependent protein